MELHNVVAFNKSVVVDNDLDLIAKLEVLMLVVDNVDTATYNEIEKLIVETFVVCIALVEIADLREDYDYQVYGVVEIIIVDDLIY